MKSFVEKLGLYCMHLYYIILYFKKVLEVLSDVMQLLWNTNVQIFVQW